MNRSRATKREDLDGLPPHDIQAEQCTLGCLLLSPDLISDTRLGGQFYDLRNQELYDLLVEMAGARDFIDTVTVQSRLKIRGRLEPIGGVAYLFALQDATPSAHAIQEYAAIVTECAQKRRLIQAAHQIAEAAMNSHSAAECVALAERLLSAENQPAQASYDGTGAGIIMVDDLERRHALGGKLSGLDTGFLRLNEYTEGLQFGEQTLIGARPSAGKTALGLNIFQKVCLDDGIPSLFVSLEMSTAALMRRMLSSWSEIPLAEIRRGTYSEANFKRFTAFKIKTSKSPMFIYDAAGGCGIAQVESTVRHHVRKHGVRLVVIDYLQKIKAATKNEKRTYEVGEVSERLKGLAVTSGAALLTLAQVNRESEKDKKPRPPRISDLADSGQIERDADTICLIHRNRDDPTGTALLIIGKQRDGQTGAMSLRFNGTYCRFENPPAVVPAQTTTQHNDP